MIKIWVGSGDGLFDTAGNWSPSGVPTDGDDVYFLKVNSTYNLTDTDDYSAITLGSINAEMGCASVGTSTGYFQICASVVNLNLYAAGGTGVPRFNLNLGSVASTVTIYDGIDQGTDSGRAIKILCNSASTVIYRLGGYVSIANSPSETSTVGTIYNGSSDTDGIIELGEGVVCTNFYNKSGIGIIKDTALTILDCKGGDVSWYGNEAITTLTVSKEANFIRYGTGTITTLNLSGSFDATQTQAALTITNTNIYEKAELDLQCGKINVITFTNPITLVACSLQDVNIYTEPGDTIGL